TILFVTVLFVAVLFVTVLFVSILIVHIPNSQFDGSATNWLRYGSSNTYAIVDPSDSAFILSRYFLRPSNLCLYERKELQLSASVNTATRPVPLPPVSGGVPATLGCSDHYSRDIRRSGFVGQAIPLRFL